MCWTATTFAAMSAAARQIEDAVYDHAEYVTSRPDAKLLSWTDVEYRLFRTIESQRLNTVISIGFSTVDEFLQCANQVLNRRKSRAGKSLEHHLAAIFNGKASANRGVSNEQYCSRCHNQ